MKKITFLLVLATLATLTTSVLLSGCSNNDDELGKDEILVGTWYDEMIGDFDDDILNITVVFKEDGTMTTSISSSSSVEEGLETYELKWGTKGNKLYFMDIDEESEDYESVEYKVSGNTLILTADDDYVWDLTRK